MTSSKVIHVLLISIFLVSCALDNTSNKTFIHRKGTSVDSFCRWVSFPYGIKSVKWEVEIRDNGSSRSIPGPSDQLIYADVECDSQAIGALNDSAVAKMLTEAKEVYLDSNFIKDWFSPEVKDIFYKKDNSVRVKNMVYKSDLKHFGRGILSQGWFAPVGKHRIFLVLRTS